MLLYSDSLILWAISIRAGSRNPVSASGDGLDSDTGPDFLKPVYGFIEASVRQTRLEVSL